MTPTAQVELASERYTRKDRRFGAFERFLRCLESLGGRILLLFLLVLAGFWCVALRVRGAWQLEVTALLTLLRVLARNPRSPGFLTGLLAIFKERGQPRRR
jgi:hypothetical protein